MSDKTLQTQVEKELQWEPSLDSSSIGVAVDKGVVTLSGAVRTYAEKIAARDAVERIKGVRGVAMDLDVRPFGDTGTSDDEIAKRVLNTLDWHSTVPSNAVKVRVDDGLVTLTGELEWQFQRDAAVRAVEKIHGVRSVSNAITLKSRVAPADVRQKIEAALQRQAHIEASGIRVSVEGGKVRLDGKVHDWADRSVIERAAWSAPGVSSVDDHVTIGA